MTASWKIYALVDPRTGEPRYVGQTRRHLSLRLKAHARERGDTYKCRWVAKLSRENLKPVMRQLYECFDGISADAAEIFYIADFKARGFRLTNISLGGSNGTVVHSEETKAKIAKTHLGIRPSPETLVKLSIASKGRKASPETRAKLSAARRGEKRPPLTAEHKAKLSAIRKGRKPSAEARVHMSEAQLRRKPTDEQRARLSASRRGKKHTAATLAKMSVAQKKSWIARKARAQREEARKCQ